MPQEQGYLILQRNEDQDIIIFLENGDEILIKVIDIMPHAKSMRFGIKAPANVDIIRREALGKRRWNHRIKKQMENKTLVRNN